MKQGMLKLIGVFFIVYGFPGLKAQNGKIVTDVEGNVYKTVTIGKQVWMAENLKTIRYSDGKNIPLVTDEKAWDSLTTPSYCWYNNDEVTYKNTCGALYNWYTVNTGKLCPTGWHVPTDAEWTTFTNYLGGATVASGKLKETGFTHWGSPNAGATNETNFTALPCGVCGGGKFNSIRTGGFWWSATESNNDKAWSRYLINSFSDVPRFDNNKKAGYSVRCVRN
jgi:uncharacterized protein (TIGR02145 family)